jgi:uncharacterized membrane protein YedE/YeeE
MSIDWVSFAPWPALIGGLVIGVGASMLVLMNGRVAGIGGIIGGAAKLPVASRNDAEIARCRH